MAGVPFCRLRGSEVEENDLENLLRSENIHTPKRRNVMVCLLTRQHLVQVDGQQQVKDAVENEHEQRDVERMRAVGQ